jgi:hypothetical protein
MLTASVVTVLLTSLLAGSGDGDVGGTPVVLVNELFPSEGSLGTVINIKGVGFGQGKKARVWIEPVEGSGPRRRLKVVLQADTLVGARLRTKKLKPGDYRVIVRPHGTSLEVEAPLPFRVREPFIGRFTQSSTGLVVIEGAHFGTRQGRVFVGKRRWHVTSWEPDRIEAKGKVKASSSEVLRVRNRVGEALAPCEIQLVHEATSGTSGAFIPTPYFEVDLPGPLPATGPNPFTYGDFVTGSLDPQTGVFKVTAEFFDDGFVLNGQRAELELLPVLSSQAGWPVGVVMTTRVFYTDGQTSWESLSPAAEAVTLNHSSGSCVISGSFEQQLPRVSGDGLELFSLEGILRLELFGALGY